MGCVGTKPSPQPLNKQTKEIAFGNNGDIHPKKKQAVIENSVPTISEIVQNKPQDKVAQDKQQLNLSAKPGWNHSDFNNIAEVKYQQLIDNSPIQIIYSSDHENKQPNHSYIKKNLFKDRPLENSVIQEVSQENVESYVNQQQGPSEKVAKRLKNSIEDANKEKEIKLSTKEDFQGFCEEQIAERFQFRLSKLQIFPSFAQA